MWKQSLIERILYRLIWSLAKTGLKIYHRRFQFAGREHKNMEYPAFYVSNHQNTLMDPVAVGCMIYKHPIFLTRADVFIEQGIRAAFFNMLKMLPIYRQRDGVDTLKKNEEIFDRCVNSLVAGESVIMFPEGNHGRKYFVRPLKKGLVRIGFKAAERSEFDLDLKIVPVGLNYSAHTKFRSDLLVNYGAPISVKDYYEDFQENPSRTMTRVMVEVRKRISHLTWHIRNQEYYDTIVSVNQAYSPKLTGDMNLERTLLNEFSVSKKLIDALEAWIPESPAAAETMRKHMEEIQQGSATLRLPTKFILSGLGSPMILGILHLFLLLGFPLFLLGWIFHYPFGLVANQVAVKNFKDDMFHSSIRMLFGMFLLPVWYLINSIIIGLLSGSFLWGICAFFLLPVAGYLSLKYHEMWKELRDSWRYLRLKLTQSKAINNLQEKSEEIYQMLKRLIQEEKKVEPVQQSH
ncbi:MAG: 1-acyl-sn-glycerol-3-phosphate acyltransferase [Bacteroidota bacterium]